MVADCWTFRLRHDECHRWRPQVSSGNNVIRTSELRWQVLDGAILCWQRNASTVRRYSFPMNAANPAYDGETSRCSFGNMRPHRDIGIDVCAKITNGADWRDHGCGDWNWNLTLATSWWAPHYLKILRQTTLQLGCYLRFPDTVSLRVVGVIEWLYTAAFSQPDQS